MFVNSLNPNDPLNQPLWKRDLQLVALSLVSIIETTLSPILATNSLSLAYDFRLNFTRVALLGIFLVSGSRPSCAFPQLASGESGVFTFWGTFSFARVAYGPVRLVTITKAWCGLESFKVSVLRRSRRCST